MKIWVEPTGKLVTGTVLDVRKEPLERALRDYDNQLYLRWNPKKLRGHGCWELRRRDFLKSIYQTVEFDGVAYIDLRFCEVDMVNHVTDMPYLNYNVITRIKAMDTTNQNQAYFVDQMESAEKSHVDAANAKRRADMIYAAKQHKTNLRAMREKLLSGWNPAEITDYWDKPGLKP